MSGIALGERKIFFTPNPEPQVVRQASLDEMSPEQQQTYKEKYARLLFKNNPTVLDLGPGSVPPEVFEHVVETRVPAPTWEMLIDRVRTKVLSAFKR